MRGHSKKNGKLRTLSYLETTVKWIVIECLDRRAPTVFVFAEEDDAKVLGVHALEGLGLEVDPITKELRKIKPILAV